jgi:DNA-directed RNA polymerase subunit RPC12/RpoP
MEDKFMEECVECGYPISKDNEETLIGCEFCEKAFTQAIKKLNQKSAPCLKGEKN